MTDWQEQKTDFSQLNHEDYGALSPKGRRRARETALLMLYQIDCGGNDFDLALGTLADIGLQGDSAQFARELVEQSLAARERVDALIDSHTQEWDFARLFQIDKEILRLALAELGGETPATIVINEAVELAKRFGDDASPAFINAVLDAVRKEQDGEESQG